MSVDTETLLTVLDILRLHRDWITMLFVEQRKTEVEIVELLYEHNLPVSLHQLHSLLQQWNLVSSSSSARSTTSIRPLSGLDGRAVPTTHEPESRNAYERRPLPLLPRSSRASSSRRARESHRAPSSMLHSQPEAVSQHRHRHRRVETELDSVSAHEGSSPLEKYVMDPQTHEMIAIGMVQPWRQGRSSL